MVKGKERNWGSERSRYSGSDNWLYITSPKHVSDGGEYTKKKKNNIFDPFIHHINHITWQNTWKLMLHVFFYIMGSFFRD
jgi:hypothetical protein